MQSDGCVSRLRGGLPLFGGVACSDMVSGEPVPVLDEVWGAELLRPELDVDLNLRLSLRSPVGVQCSVRPRANTRTRHGPGPGWGMGCETSPENSSRQSAALSIVNEPSAMSSHTARSESTRRGGCVGCRDRHPYETASTGVDDKPARSAAGTDRGGEGGCRSRRGGEVIALAVAA